MKKGRRPKQPQSQLADVLTGRSLVFRRVPWGSGLEALWGSNNEHGNPIHAELTERMETEFGSVIVAAGPVQCVLVDKGPRYFYVMPTPSEKERLRKLKEERLGRVLLAFGNRTHITLRELAAFLQTA